MEATIHSAYVEGVTATPIKVTVRMALGPPAGPRLLGEPDDTSRAKELRVRVRSALIASGYEKAAARSWSVELDPPLPAGATTGALDLPIAWAVIQADAGGMKHSRVPLWAFGTLGLDGAVHPARGLAAALATVPAGGLAAVPVRSEDVPPDVSAKIEGFARLSDCEGPAPRISGTIPRKPEGPPLSEIPENLRAWHTKICRLVETGTRAVVLVGAPGAGKTMLARRLWTSILERAEYDPELARVFSCAGLAASGWPAFRAPHHTASVAAMVGGGTPVRPGEVTLAHRGVLLLDEILEFPRTAVAELATTLRRGTARVVRRGSVVEMPAAPALVVAATNACPCGRLGAAPVAPRPLCACPPHRRAYHEDKIVSAAHDLGAEICDLRKDP